MSSTTTTGRSKPQQERERGWGTRTVLVIVTWAVLCGLVIGWGWLLTHSLEKSIEPTDDDISRWFAAQRDPTLTDAADAGTFLGETLVGASTFAVICLVVAAVRRTWRPLILLAVVEAGLGGFYFFGTELVPRDRPPVKLLDAGLVPDASYPSGHVATALVCWAGTVLLVWTYFRAARWVALLLLLLPLFTLLSRLYLGAHYLTDALTSVVYAGTWLLVVARQVLPRASTGSSGEHSA
jgi:membrane-associated phospholipid phosphatase